MARTTLSNVHMNIHTIYNYVSFSWPFLHVALDVLHWATAQDRIWLRLHRLYKLVTCVNGSSLVLYTRLLPCLHWNCQEVSTGNKMEDNNL